MTTRLQMKNRVLYLLGDPEGTQFDDTLVIQAIESAMDAILPWYSKPMSTTFLGDGATTGYAVPADIYRIIAVFDPILGKYVSQDMMSPNVNANDVFGWRDYPYGEVHFSQYVPAGVSYNFYYGAYWTKPVDDASVLETPMSLDNAISFWASAYCLLPKAYQASNVRQYNVQVDSGNPIQNPVKDISDYFMVRFKWEMDMLPGRMKGVK